MNSSADRRTLPVGILALTVPAASLGHAAGQVPAGWGAAGGLTLATLAWIVTRRDRNPVAVVAPVADIRAITAGHKGVPKREPALVEAA